MHGAPALPLVGPEDLQSMTSLIKSLPGPAFCPLDCSTGAHFVMKVGKAESGRVVVVTS